MKRILVVLLLTVMAMSMVGCEGQTKPEVQNAPTEETVVETEVTEETVVEEPGGAEETVVETEAPEEPTEMPTEDGVEDNPNVIDGIDFTEFNKQYHEEKEGDYIYVWDVMHQQAKYDNLRIVVISDAKAEAILADGDSIVQEEENGSYNLFIYRPKKIVSMEKIGGDEVELIETTYPSIAGMLEIGYEVTGTDIEAGVKVTYEDGTQESITIYVTKDYEG